MNKVQLTQGYHAGDTMRTEHIENRCSRTPSCPAQLLQARHQAHKWESIQMMPAPGFELLGWHRVEPREAVPIKPCTNCELLDVWAKRMLLFLKPLSWEMACCADLGNWNGPLPASQVTSVCIKVQKYGFSLSPSWKDTRSASTKNTSVG